MRYRRWLGESWLPIFLVVEDMNSKGKEPPMSARNIFRSAFDSMVEARQRQVSRYVNGVLLSFDDETLKAHGYTREELRRRGAINTVF